MERPLVGKVAVVTGGSRGVGKGVALELGAAGATVYVTGRTVQEGQGPWPGTIMETAAEVTALGGHGVAVRCDHREDADVEALFRRVREEQGRLDILVNNAFATPEGPSPVGVPFWQLPLSYWDDLHTVGLRSHYVASRLAVPLMLPEGRGLIVHISSSGGNRYTFSVAYGAQKGGLEKMMRDMAHELRPHNIAVLSLWPGWVKSEKTVPGRLPQEMYEAVLKLGETPRFTGRAVTALASDPSLMDRSGHSLVVAEIAQHYGFTDIDGTQPAVPEWVVQLRQSRA